MWVLFTYSNRDSCIFIYMFILGQEEAALMIDEVDNTLLDEFDSPFHYFCDAKGVLGEYKSALLYDEYSSLMTRSNPFQFLLRADKVRRSCRLLLDQIGDNSLKLCTKRTRITGTKVQRSQSILQQWCKAQVARQGTGILIQKTLLMEPR